MFKGTSTRIEYMAGAEPEKFLEFDGPEAHPIRKRKNETRGQVKRGAITGQSEVSAERRALISGCTGNRTRWRDRDICNLNRHPLEAQVFKIWEL